MSVAIARYENLIGGEWVDAVEGGTEQIVNPATGDVIAEVPRGTEADVERAVKAAKDALPAWLETTPAERAGMLLELADAVEEHADELARAESQNVGKPMVHSRFELGKSVDNLRFFAGATRCL
jgi:acyl-CoA reductase-like NAD-dependent aldehyde dehydrogenase